MPGLRPGTTFAGRYEIVRQLGRGGMGAVYLARDSRLERQVALKLPFLWGDDDPEFLHRFYREARAAAGLRHPNICRVYDVAEHEGQPYLTMEYLEGVLLSDHLKTRSKPMEPENAFRLVRKLAQVMDAAHQQGIVHRDLKPANIMLDLKAGPIVMDFGLARREDREESLRTRAGQQIGTPAYMSLEQFQGKVDAIGPRSDIYSLGVILFELLTGKRPYEGNAFEIHTKLLRSDPPAPSSIRPELDTTLDWICQKAMARDIEDRYASMADFVAALGAALKSRSSSLAILPPGDANSPGLAPASANDQMPQPETGGLATAADFRPKVSESASLGGNGASFPNSGAEPAPEERSTDLARLGIDRERRPSAPARPAGLRVRLPRGLNARRAAGIGIAAVLLLVGGSVLTMYSAQSGSRPDRLEPHESSSSTPAARPDDTQPKAVDRAEETVQSRLDRAESYLQQGQYDEAVREFDRAIRLDSKSPRAHYGRGAALFEKKDYYHALEDVGEAIRLEPEKMAPARLVRARIHLAYGNVDLALEEYERALKLDPSLSLSGDNRLGTAYLSRGNALRDRGQWNDAVVAYDRAIQFSPNDPQSHIERGKAHHHNGNRDQAIADLSEAMKLVPPTFDVLVERGNAYLEASRLREAIGDLSGAIQLHATDLTAQCSRCLAYYYGGEFDLAIADAEAALMSRSDCVQALLIRAAANEEKGLYDLAIADCTNALSLRPGSVLALGIRREAHTNKGDIDEAESDRRSALALNPQSPAELNYHAQCFDLEQDRDRALSELDQALRAVPDYVVALANRASLYRRRGDFERALSDVERAIKLNSRVDWLHATRAQIVAAQGDLVRAIGDVDTAIRVSSTARKPQFLHERGHLHSQKGDDDQAITDFGEAIRLDPNYARAYICRGLALLKKGDSTRGNEDLEKAVLIPPRMASTLIARGGSFRELKNYDRADR